MGTVYEKAKKMETEIEMARIGTKACKHKLVLVTEIDTQQT